MASVERCRSLHCNRPGCAIPCPAQCKHFKWITLLTCLVKESNPGCVLFLFQQQLQIGKRASKPIIWCFSSGAEISILPEVDIRCWADSVGLANALNLVHKATFLKDRNLFKLIWRLLLEIILTASGFSPNFKFQNS